MGGALDRVAAELLALCEQTERAAERLTTAQATGWRSLAGDRFRREVGALAQHVSAIAAQLQDASALAADHAAALDHVGLGPPEWAWPW